MTVKKRRPMPAPPKATKMLFRKRLKVGFILDLHLGHNPFDNKQATAEDMRVAYQQSLLEQLRYLHGKGCDVVAFGGDTFDTPHPDNEDIAMLISALACYPKFKYYFIPGNHEIESNHIHALTTLMAVSKISKISITVVRLCEAHMINGFPVTFMGYPFTHPNFDDPGLIVMHNEFRGAKRDNGSIFEKGEEFSSERAEKLNQLYVSGHLHTYQRIGKEIGGYAEPGHRRLSSGRIYFGRLGGMRHEAGDFDIAGIVTMTKEKGQYVYDIENYSISPFWIIQAKRYANRSEFLDHMNWVLESGVHLNLISIRVKADSPYIPTPEELGKSDLYRFVTIEAKKSAYDELQEQMNDNEAGRQTKNIGTYMDDWLDRISSAKLRGFALNRFEQLRKKIGG